MLSAFLDTSVLWPSLQRDFLLSLAVEGLYRPLWSEAILEELQGHEAEKLEGLGFSGSDAAARTKHLIGQMREAFSDALVTGWEPLEGAYGLPDPDDEHVVAAAFTGGAAVIVTDNVRHFPASRIPRRIDVQDARTFAACTVSVDPKRGARALQEIARRHANPKHTADELLDILVGRYGMDEVGEVLRIVLSVVGGRVSTSRTLRYAGGTASTSQTPLADR